MGEAEIELILFIMSALATVALAKALQSSGML